MAINSKNKGNAFERKIAKLLSERFAEKTGIEASLRRNADSGSFFGGKNKARVGVYDTEKATMGDLICPSAFRFTIECKHYKEPPSFLSMLKQDNKTFDKWLEQAEQDAESAGKLSLIIAKFNNVPEMVLIRSSLYPQEFNLQYKGFAIVLLEDFLSLGDDFFF